MWLAPSELQNLIAVSRIFCIFIAVKELITMHSFYFPFYLSHKLLALLIKKAVYHTYVLYFLHASVFNIIHYSLKSFYSSINSVSLQPYFQNTRIFQAWTTKVVLFFIIHCGSCQVKPLFLRKSSKPAFRKLHKCDNYLLSYN